MSEIGMGDVEMLTDKKRERKWSYKAKKNL